MLQRLLRGEDLWWPGPDREPARGKRLDLVMAVEEVFPGNGDFAVSQREQAWAELRITAKITGSLSKWQDSVGYKDVMKAIEDLSPDLLERTPRD